MAAPALFAKARRLGERLESWIRANTGHAPVRDRRAAGSDEGDSAGGED